MNQISRNTHSLSLAHCLRSRWNMIEPDLRADVNKEVRCGLQQALVAHQPTTAVQYTSGGAKIRSSLRRMPLCKGDDVGSAKTVSAFSSESQWVVRNGLCPWNPDKSEDRLNQNHRVCIPPWDLRMTWLTIPERKL